MNMLMPDPGYSQVPSLKWVPSSPNRLDSVTRHFPIRSSCDKNFGDGPPRSPPLSHRQTAPKYTTTHRLVGLVRVLPYMRASKEACEPRRSDQFIVGEIKLPISAIFDALFREPSQNHPHASPRGLLLNIVL